MSDCDHDICYRWPIEASGMLCCSVCEMQRLRKLIEVRPEEQAKKLPRVILGIPGAMISSPTFHAVLRSVEEAKNHQLMPISYTGIIGWQNFCQAWCDALNASRYQGVDYFVMLHTDVEPSPNWINEMVATMQERPELGLLSIPCRIKCDRGLLSCGAGDTVNNWWPHRRLSTYELLKLPRVASVTDLMATWKLKPFSGLYMIHNNGCWIADPKKPEWRKEVKNRSGNDCMPCFTFPLEIHEETHTDGRIVAVTKSNPEDFEFSWMAHQAGIESAILTCSPTNHYAGSQVFSSHSVIRPGQPFGMQKFDYDVNRSDAHTEEEKRFLKAKQGWFSNPAGMEEAVQA